MASNRLTRTQIEKLREKILKKEAEYIEDIGQLVTKEHIIKMYKQGKSIGETKLVAVESDKPFDRGYPLRFG